VAVISLMTLTAASNIAAPGSAEFIAAALVLALLSGLLLLLMGVLRLGFLANLLSHPVVSGFITASGIIIATSQMKSILGIAASGEAMPELLQTLARNVGGINLPTLIIGVSATAFLFWVRKGLKPLLITFGIAPRAADLTAKAGPIVVVAISTLAVMLFDLEASGVKVVGAIPQSLPPFTVPLFDAGLWQQLFVPALLLSIIGFVESVSVAQTLAAKKRQRIDPNQELIGLGAANIAASFSGGYPVTGGFARSVVNFDAGAETPAAGAFTAIGIAIAALFLTPLLASLPIATLAHLALFEARFRSDGGNSASHIAGRCGTRSDCRRQLIARALPMARIASTCCHRRTRAGNRTFSECQTSQGVHRPPHPDHSHRRELNLLERTLA
jgi:SulP family sulfate permease